MKIGTVREVWRYPVKSMIGERINGSWVANGGVVGDRGWALRDEAAGEIRGAKKLTALMRCTARYVGEPREASVTHAEIELPDGERLRTDDPEASRRLSQVLGRTVTLCSLRPPDDRDHYRRAVPDNPDMLGELRAIFGRLEDEPLPDLSSIPPELMEFTSPLGTYFDAFPIHLLTTSSLAALHQHNPAASFDVRRFRPNVVIEPENDGTGLVEQVTSAIERHLADPAVAAFAAAIADQGLIYQSDAFGTTLAQVFGLARLLGSQASAPAGPGRVRRPLPACSWTARAAPASAAWRRSSTPRPTAARRQWRSHRATS